MAKTKPEPRPGVRAPQQAREQRRIDLATAQFLEAQRALVLVIVGGCVLVFARAANDSFSTPKVTVLLLGAVALLALSVVRVLRGGVALIVYGPASWLAGAMVLSMVASTVVNHLGGISVLGQYGRYEGLLPYLSYVVLLFTVLRVSDTPWLRRMVMWLVWILGATVAYGVLQILGLDPFHWQFTPRSHAFSTFGQENFAAGAVATLLPLAVGLVLSRGVDIPIRRAAGIVGVGAALVIWRANSFQGPVAAFVGLVPLAIVVVVPRLLAGREEGSRRFVRVGVAGGVVVLAALALVGPHLLRGTVDQLRLGTNERQYLWDAGVRMFRERPVLGGGFGRYAREFSSQRPAEHALRFGPLWSDSPHSVIIAMLVSGGLVLGATYLALIGYVGYCLITGLRRLRGDDQVLLAAVGGGWLAYQVQSLVSIDVPAVAVLQWVLAGAVIYLGRRPPERLVHLGPVRDPSKVTTGWRSLEVSVAVVALIAAWFAIRPLRADLASGEARDAKVKANPTVVMRAAKTAVDLMPWEPTYLNQLAAGYVSVDRDFQAFQIGERAARLDTGHTITALATADLAEQLGDRVAAERWFREAMKRDPHWGGAYDGAGRFYGRIGKSARSIELLRRATELSPSSAAYLRDYGEALIRAGRLQEGITVLEHSLTLEADTRATTIITATKKALSETQAKSSP